MSNCPRPPSRDTPRNLLFGLLALQNNFISRDALVAAFGAWIAGRSRPLDQILLDQGQLDADCHALLMGLVRQHLRLHGDDPEVSLADLRSNGSLHRRLSDLGDPELSASLSHVAAAHTVARDPDATATFLGALSPSGDRYKVLRLHAEGGLGEVYVARDEEVRREVALKQIRTVYAGDPQCRARFLLEAEITGGLEHPGIVPVYGLGTHADGRPFYAMRFVRGVSLKQAIARFHSDATTRKDPGLRTLALQKLLRRFLDVCNAVAYAHSRGVLHRDLKPGNIMLGDYGETLVVDWGLAKAVGHHLESPMTPGREGTLRPESGSNVQPTVVGQRLGTPAYMPPEQAEGRLEELGAASDVYSLGATLYVILTGLAPFTDPDLPTLLRKVEQGEFARPRQVRGWIDPALEAVCLKAMARRPEDRYPSPRALAEDVEHWLADEAVSARRDPLRTRSWRWVRKHRTLATSAAAVVLLTAVGLGVGLQRERLHAARVATERSEAERRLDQVMTSYEEYFSGFNAQALRERNLPPELLEALLTKPRAFYAAFTAELAAKPRPTEQEEALLARGHSGLGRMLGILGRHAESRRELESAIGIYSALAREHPEIPDHRDRLATAQNGLGNVLKATGRAEEAMQAYREAIATWERLAEEHPDHPDYRANVARSQSNLGGVLQNIGRPEAAEAAYRRSIDALARLARDRPDLPDYLHGLARNYNDLGLVLVATDRLDDAKDAYREAIALLGRFDRARPGNPEYWSLLSNAYTNLGIVLAKEGRPEEALDAFNQSVADAERLVNDQPGVPIYRSTVAHSYGNLGILLAASGRAREAEDAYGRAIEEYARLARDQPGVPDYRGGSAWARLNLGGMLARGGRFEKAKETFDEAIRGYRRLVAENPGRPDYRDRLGGALGSQARILIRRREFESATALFRESIGHHRAAVDRSPRVIEFRETLSHDYRGLAICLRALGRAGEAAEATRAWSKLGPGDSSELYDAACEFALCVPISPDAASRGRHADEAMTALRAAVSAGWSDAVHTARDPDLDPIRERPDFRSLLEELFDRGFPADPFAP
jgi:serine/threonine-protein kinase